MNFFKKMLAFSNFSMYNARCCDMIAVKREVAAQCNGALEEGEIAVWQGIPWSECQVRKLTTSHCTDRTVYYK